MRLPPYLVLIASALSVGVNAQAPLPVSFDIIVSSGSGTANGLTVPAPVLIAGDNPGNIFQFDGQTGEFKGFFAEEFDNGLQDPRDLVIQGPLLSKKSKVLVNVADFNNPSAPPGDGEIQLDGVYMYNSKGKFIKQVIDFREYDMDIAPGGGVFGPTTDISDDPEALNYFIGSRVQGEVFEIDLDEEEMIGPVAGTETISFPRGFVFTADGTLYIGSGSNPGTGEGDDAILKINPSTGESETFFSSALTGIPFSPLDVILSPGGTALITTSESPFSPGVVTPSQVVVIPLNFETPEDVIVIDPGFDDQGNPYLVDPRGLGIGPDGLLYVSSAGSDRLLRFDPFTYEFLGVFAEMEGLNGQALNFIPTTKKSYP